jgi:prevent-host-death family protein
LIIERVIYNMTMVMNKNTISASEFKAKCLALLDRVSKSGRPLSITKRGKVVARLFPAQPVERRPLRGSVVRQGDLIAPIDVQWEAEK